MLFSETLLAFEPQFLLDIFQYKNKKTGDMI